MAEQPQGRRFQAPKIEATLMLDGTAGPISGTVTAGEREPRSFFGWLELMDALEELRVPEGRRVSQGSES